MCSWTGRQVNEFIRDIQFTVDRESRWLANRYNIPQQVTDISNEVYLTLLARIHAGSISPTEAQSFVARQESRESYEVREAARCAARRIAGRTSMQAVALDTVGEPEMPVDVERKLSELMADISSALEHSYDHLTPTDREILMDEASRSLGITHGTTRTDAQRQALRRARKKVSSNPAPLLSRLMAGMLALCAAFQLVDHQGTALYTSDHQVEALLVEHQVQELLGHQGGGSAN